MALPAGFAEAARTQRELARIQDMMDTQGQVQSDMMEMDSSDSVTPRIVIHTTTAGIKFESVESAVLDGRDDEGFSLCEMLQDIASFKRPGRGRRCKRKAL